jgi:hypothetical protein
VFGERVHWRALAAWSARRTPLFLGVALLVWGGVVGAQLAARVRLEGRKALPPGVTRATTVPGRTEQQGWGTLHLDQSVEGKPLTAGRTTWAFGFGTHAPSTITLPVPAGARRFRSFVALDDESRNGRAGFEVWVDGQLRWTSGPLESGAAPRECEVQVQGARSLELRVDPLGPVDADHADWLEPQFSSAP